MTEQQLEDLRAQREEVLRDLADNILAGRRMFKIFAVIGGVCSVILGSLYYLMSIIRDIPPHGGH